MPSRFLRPRCALLLLACALTACGSSGAEDSEAEAVTDLPPGTIRGSITYAGTASGTVKLALFRSFPPTGAPVASAQYEAATFPLAYELPAPAGRYTVLCFLGGKDEGHEPAMGDPQAAPMGANIPPGGNAIVDLTLGE